MRQTAISVALIVLGLSGFSHSAENEDEGMPWVARAEYGGFLLPKAPLSGTQGTPYQWGMLHGVTAQVFPQLLLHGGMRFRETLAPGFSQPLREPLMLQFSGMAELLSGWLYAFGGGGVPFGSGSVPVTDSAALDETLSRHVLFPDGSIGQPATLDFGLATAVRVSASNYFVAFQFHRPGRFTALESAPFTPAWQLQLTLRAETVTPTIRHRLDFRGSRYGYEATLEGRNAHREGPSFQMRYAALGLGGDRAAAFALGLAIKLSDENRQILLDLPLETTAENDNRQRVYMEYRQALKEKHFNCYWTASLRPQLVFFPKEKPLYEALSVFKAWRSVFREHGLEGEIQLLVGSDAGQPYYGMGGKVAFTFRHLGPPEDTGIGVGTVSPTLPPPP